MTWDGDLRAQVRDEFKSAQRKARQIFDRASDEREEDDDVGPRADETPKTNGGKRRIVRKERGATS